MLSHNPEVAGSSPFMLGRKGRSDESQLLVIPAIGISRSLSELSVAVIQES